MSHSRDPGLPLACANLSFSMRKKLHAKGKLALSVLFSILTTVHWRLHVWSVLLGYVLFGSPVLRRTLTHLWLSPSPSSNSRNLPSFVARPWINNSSLCPSVSAPPRSNLPEPDILDRTITIQIPPYLPPLFLVFPLHRHSPLMVPQATISNTSPIAPM